ncbi:hypothetical protein CROQUDRAFT_706484 [Cronartium quercuum f. sp. fusiforme G11]|uniref:Uncharacterized protein n=1 Tax=Cronartium quercuum f. sp. fusiforme G11 TaxID=708437 RepID=A0A9P6NG34_9BASI|nr:hypothetical protein CROQUDRAFT_706484 [Cronartium quercuum f. sp. fusiforme G11]
MLANSYSHWCGHLSLATFAALLLRGTSALPTTTTNFTNSPGPVVPVALPALMESVSYSKPPAPGAPTATTRLATGCYDFFFAKDGGASRNTTNNCSPKASTGPVIEICQRYDPATEVGLCLWSGSDPNGVERKKSGWLSSSATENCGKEMRADCFSGPARCQNQGLFQRTGVTLPPVLVTDARTTKAFLALNPTADEINNGCLAGSVTWDLKSQLCIPTSAILDISRTIDRSKRHQTYAVVHAKIQTGTTVPDGIILILYLGYHHTLCWCEFIPQRMIDYLKGSDKETL